MSGAHQSMTACLVERINIIRSRCDNDVQAWYDDGANLNEFSGIGRIVVGEAWSYIQGAADYADLTVMELLDEHGLSLDRAILPLMSGILEAVQVDVDGLEALDEALDQLVDQSRAKGPARKGLGVRISRNTYTATKKGISR